MTGGSRGLQKCNSPSTGFCPGTLAFDSARALGHTAYPMHGHSHISASPVAGMFIVTIGILPF
jgi:hypothetical protein